MRETLSRRGMFGLGGAAFAAASWPGRVLADTPPADTDEKNIQGANDKRDRLTIEGTINGRGPFRFVVDTGAERTVIADDVALSLGLLPSDDVNVQGIARAVPARTVIAKTLKFGEVSVENLAIPVLPRNWLGIDGYLGLDAIDGHRVRFDFRGRQLTISSPQSKWQTEFISPSEAVVRADGTRGRLKAVDCHVDGVHSYAFVDTGAECSIGNSHLFAELARGGASFLPGDPIQLSGVTGGFVPGRVLPARSVRLGTLNFANSLLIIADLPVFDVWELGDKPALFIGMNFLSEARTVVVDYGRQEYRFQFADVRIAELI